MKSEYAQWVEELERPRLTIAERVARWFERPAEQEPDHFEWKSVEELFR